MKRIACALLLASACVTNGTYHKKIADLTKLHDDDVAAERKKEAELDAKLKDVNGKLDKATADGATLQKNYDDQMTVVAAMKQKLEQLGQNVDALTKEKGALTQGMADANQRLEELRKAKAAADARAAVFKTLVEKLHAMVDSGQLKVVIRNGRMVIALPNDILFESGKTDVKKAGKEALANVAKVLATVGDRDFIVAGHTDNVPIKTAAFASNWELSTARAVVVVKFLIEKGMNGKTLAAAGYGEFDPVVANDSADHQAQNRRIEIVLQPNLSDLPPLDDLMKK